MSTPMVTLAGLIAEVDGQAAAKKAAIAASMPAILELNALTAKLHEAGVEVYPLVSIHDNSISAWVQCHDSEESVLDALMQCDLEVVSARPCEWLSNTGGMEFRLADFEAPLILPLARARQQQEAA